MAVTLKESVPTWRQETFIAAGGYPRLKVDRLAQPRVALVAPELLLAVIDLRPVRLAPLLGALATVVPVANAPEVRQVVVVASANVVYISGWFQTQAP